MLHRGMKCYVLTSDYCYEQMSSIPEFDALLEEFFGEVLHDVITPVFKGAAGAGEQARSFISDIAFAAVKSNRVSL